MYELLHVPVATAQLERAITRDSFVRSILAVVKCRGGCIGCFNALIGYQNLTMLWCCKRPMLLLAIYFPVIGTIGTYVSKTISRGLKPLSLSLRFQSSGDCDELDTDRRSSQATTNKEIVAAGTACPTQILMFGSIIWYFTRNNRVLHSKCGVSSHLGETAEKLSKQE